jgi:hypothetical protein
MAVIDRIQGLLGELGCKAPVLVATNAAITLYGEQTIDGVAVVAEDRVLVKDQADATTNGIYYCQVTTWVRAPDFDGTRDALQGTLVNVAQGTINALTLWTLTTEDPVIGTSTLVFAAVTFASSSDSITNVVDYGAVGDGVTDDTAAFQAALSSTNKHIYVPSGDYALSGQLTHAGKALTLRGAGMNSTRLMWDSASASTGIAFTQADDDYRIDVSGLSFVTEKPGTGTAIYVDGAGQLSGGIVQSRSKPRLLVSDVEFRGATSTSVDGWGVGIDCVDVMAVQIRGIYFTGKYTTTATNIISESMCRFSGTGSPVQISVMNCDAYYALETIKFTDVEGAFVQNCNLVSVDKGVVFNPAVVEPQLQCINNHINAYVTAIEITNCAQANISQNLIYSRSGALVVVKGIHVNGTSTYNNFSNNVFVAAAGASTLDAIVLESGAQYNMISDNVFQSAKTAVEYMSGANNNFTGQNVFGTGVATQVTDGGTSNVMVRVRAGSIEVPSEDAKIELGSITASNTPFIDFRSSGLNTDYDVRVTASGGGASSGLGTLTHTGAAHVFSGVIKPLLHNTTDLGVTGTAAWRNLYLGTSMFVGGIKVVGAQETGWTNTMTGTANKATAYDTSTITLVQLAERVKALTDMLRAHGLMGA